MPLLITWPFHQSLTALENPNAIAEVIAQNDVETRQENFDQIIREIAQSCSLFQWEHVLVRDVPVKDELIRGITLIQSNQLIRPRWEIRLRHYWIG